MAEKIRSIVVDNGSGRTKCGFSGEDKPQKVFPTVITRIKKDKKKKKNKNLESKEPPKKKKVRQSYCYPIENGIVAEWKDMEHIWKYMFKSALKVKSHNYPILLTEPPLNPLSNREKTAEIMFEKFKVPALYFQTQAVLSLYSNGKLTGLVLDCGHGVSHVVPVVAGFAINAAVQRLNIAGEEITNFLMNLLSTTNDIALTTTAQSEAVRVIKEKYSYVAQDFEKSMKGEEADLISYELPDGRTIEIGKEMFTCTEILFKPNMIDVDALGIDGMILDAISKSGIDTRRELLNNIVLSGGTTLIKGLSERLQASIEKQSPRGTKVKINAPQNREFAVWIGGAILADLKMFEDMWVSKEEYYEVGPSILHKERSAF